MLYELRHYYIHPGKMEAFIDIMESLVIPFQHSQGMFVIGSFIDTEDENCYVWLRRYLDEADKQAVYDRVYGSDYWKNEIRPKFADMIDRERNQVTLMTPTPSSLLQ